MNALGVIGLAALATLYLWVFWGLYVLVMGIYRAYLAGRLTTTTKLLGAPFVLAGIVMDVLANLTLAGLVFVELPREWLVTDRLQRHVRTPTSAWRTRLATWVCDHLLDVFDPRGDHC